MLDLTEFIRWGYHQKLTPNLLPPDDMMFIYKNLLAEAQDDNAANGATEDQVKYSHSGMIGYVSFKKAIIRISAMAQEKLGTGANEDLLKAKLDREAKVLAKEE